jgi:pimeloyl-ACP methyl ester carboxylesterase
MALALRNPQTISALIPVDNSPIDAALASDFGKYVQGMRVIEDAKLTKQSDADAVLQKYEEALPIRQFLLTNLTRSPDTKALKFRIPIKTLASSLSHLADFPFRDPDEMRYEGPTLFVRGLKSHYVADEALPLIGRFFPRFELLDIESGHWVISEKPEEFRRGVVDFLQRK